jgi:hypothetical protein
MDARLRARILHRIETWIFADPRMQITYPNIPRLVLQLLALHVLSASYSQPFEFLFQTKHLPDLGDIGAHIVLAL